MTLFNVASNRFFAFYHEEAAEVLERMLAIIRMFEMKVLAYLFALRDVLPLAVAYMKSGNSGRAYEYWRRLSPGGSSPTRGRTKNTSTTRSCRRSWFERGPTRRRGRLLLWARDYLARENDIIVYMAPRFIGNGGGRSGPEGTRRERPASWRGRFLGGKAGESLLPQDIHARALGPVL
jgi:hypothetical protein